MTVLSHWFVHGVNVCKRLFSRFLQSDKKLEVAVKNHGLFGLIRKNSMGEKDGKVTKGKMKPPLPLGGAVRPPIKGSRLDAEGERLT